MRQPVITLSVDEETAEYFVSLQHQPGCDCGETDALFLIPREVAETLAAGAGKLIARYGKKVEGGALPSPSPDLPRPAELDDADRS